MQEPYLGQIDLFASIMSLKDWAHCAGQLMQVKDNQALFSLLGTEFGGDGTTTFALPELRSKEPDGCRFFIALRGEYPHGG